MMKAWIVALFILLSGNTLALDTDSTRNRANSKRAWYSPHYFPLQFAGNIGFLSAGVGYQSKRENYQVAIAYGFAPASLAGTNSHLISGKNTFHLRHFSIAKERYVVPYLALGVSIEVGGKSFLFLPDHMPDGYYDYTKALHFFASAGLKYKQSLRCRRFRTIEVFAEATSLDVYIWYKFMSDEVKWSQITNAAIGVNLVRR